MSIDRALQIAVLATIGGLYWQFINLSGAISATNERVAVVETRLYNVEERLGRLEDNIDAVAVTLNDINARLSRIEGRLEIAPEPEEKP